MEQPGANMAGLLLVSWRMTRLLDVTHELGIINAVGAALTCARLETDVAETDAAR